jgi:transposase InsO family protein
MKDAELIQEGDTLEDQEFHCDACMKGKSVRQVSRTPQPRCQDAAWKFHADTQTMTPLGPYGEHYWVPIVDDMSRFVEGIFVKKKEAISDHMITFCKRIKLIAGRFPGIWRLDNGTEFTKFIKWAEKEGMKFEFSPPYTAEPNGIIERTGGYVNEMARVMILDAALPEKLWPQAVDAAIYTINRLANPKTGKSPIQVWRENLNIINAKPSLTHLRPWGSKAYAHIPKAKRVQSEKMAARAIEVRVMGYVGDHGHQFKVWDPKTGRIHTTRDVGFPQHGDDKGDGNGTAADTSPKKPIEPTGSGGGGSAVSDPPNLDEEVKKPRNPIKQVIRLPQQALVNTPSP